jgi:hypothetical protein
MERLREECNITFSVVFPLSFVRAARYTLGSQDHIFRIGGKTIMSSDLHQCNDHEVALANFIKIQIESEGKK